MLLSASNVLNIRFKVRRINGENTLKIEYTKVFTEEGTKATLFY